MTPYEIINERIQQNIKDGTPLCFDKSEFGSDWKNINEVKEYYRKQGYVFSSLTDWFSMRFDLKASLDPKLYYQGECKPILKRDK